MLRMFAVFLFGFALSAFAQQGSAAKSSSGNAQGSSSQSSSSTPAQPSPNAAKTQTLSPATPDELRFPEDDPSSQPLAPQPANPASSQSDEVPVQDLGPASGDSSSKDTPVDLNAPSDDAKTHPQSSDAVAHAEADSFSPNGVTEFHAWDPHKAAKDVEVGDFYFKRGNFRAAEARYRDAMLYKENDAIATFHLAECLEKLGILDDARAQYESYLKILPHGPEAEKAGKRIAKLKAETESK